MGRKSRKARKVSGKKAGKRVARKGLRKKAARATKRVRIVTRTQGTGPRKTKEREGG